MNWIGILQQYWPSLAAAVALVASFVLTKENRAKIRQTIAGIKLPDLNGEQTPKDAATACIATLQAERVAIENAAAELQERRSRLAEAEALLVKGGSA